MKMIKKYSKGFTLIEVIIASSIVLIAGLSILSLLIHTMYIRKTEKERSIAIIAAAKKMEDLKKVLFPYLKASSENITLDVKNTPTNTADDIPATLIVNLYDKNKNSITNVPQYSNDFIIVEVRVNWTSRGKNYFQKIANIFTP